MTIPDSPRRGEDWAKRFAFRGLGDARICLRARSGRCSLSLPAGGGPWWRPRETRCVTGPPVNPGEASEGTSLGLLERVKACDPAAWERVVSVYGPLIDRWSRQAGLQEADAA